MTYESATKQQAQEIWSEVDRWMDEAPMAWIFGDCKSSSRKAIGEYIANQKGLSLWPPKSHHPKSG